MQAYHTTSTISQAGALVLTGLPFPPGDEVEVTVEPKHGSLGQIFRGPLAGVPVEYIAPTEPAIPPEDWEALNDASS